MNATTAASNTRGECLEITQGETMHSKHDGKRDGAESKTDNISTDGGRDSGETKHIATIKRGRNMTNDNNNACVMCGEKMEVRNHFMNITTKPIERFIHQTSTIVNVCVYCVTEE